MLTEPLTIENAAIACFSPKRLHKWSSKDGLASGEEDPVKAAASSRGETMSRSVLGREATGCGFVPAGGHGARARRMRQSHWLAHELQLWRFAHPGVSFLAPEQSPWKRQSRGEDDVPRGNDSDRYVQPNKERGGWDVVKEGHKRVSAHEQRKADAVKVARRIIENQGGGELRIKDEQGQFIDSDTIKGRKHRQSKAADTR